MPENEPPVRWAPRVAPTRLRRLYQADARGIYDDELIDVVGFGLYARCQSILTVTEAAHGRVACPKCETMVLRETMTPDEVLRCACGWETIWDRYHRTWQHQELYGGGAVDAFDAFVREWPHAKTPQRKMLLIDQLIHLWHWQARDDHALGRPVGVNLIEGSRAQVLALLDEINYEPSGAMPSLPHDESAATRETHANWRATWQQVRDAQRRRRRDDDVPEEER